MRHATLLTAAAFALMSGCARVAVHFDRDPPGRPLASRTQQVAFLGLHNFSRPIDLSHDCPEGWGEFTTRVTALQALFHVVTLNLYSPWTAETACRASKKN
jgi:hypothetical protein